MYRPDSGADIIIIINLCLKEHSRVLLHIKYLYLENQSSSLSVQAHIVFIIFSDNDISRIDSCVKSSCNHVVIMLFQLTLHNGEGRARAC